MSKKTTKQPNSDIRSPHRREDMLEEMTDPLPESLEGRQTSNKEGLRSTGQKLGASRSEFAPRPSAGPVSGAFGDGEPPEVGTGRYRCDSCGRYFDDQALLRMHQNECRIAKAATREGERELAKEQRTRHAPNDRDK
jgi:hypothetical protein